MKRKIITLGTILLLHSIISGQYIPQIIPPSPNAASIAKFVESPVSYYRGSANVNIPLFNIDTGDIPLNVSIQYDTKGVRVGEAASSVGTGWSLSVGGLITRQVRQRPDENGRGYLTYSYNSDFEANAVLRKQLYDENVSSGDDAAPVDEDPDLFFISFLGRSGKFIIDNVTKKAVVQGFDDWKVDIDYEDLSTGNLRINKIVITDEQGNKYYFGKDSADVSSAYDIVTSINSKLIAPVSASTPAQDNGYKTAWHLREVKTQKGSCLFEYTPEQVVTYSKSDLNKGDNVGSISLSTTKTTQQVLQKISFPEGNLSFVYNPVEREDLKGGKALNTIILKDNKGGQIKKVSFMQSYRLGDGNHINIHSLVLQEDTKSDKRLFLNQVDEAGRDNGTVSSYKLEYNPKELPNRHSNSIDYWGYYNGVQNSMNIFTDIKDGNRDVYGSNAEAGILTKIIYPTGGSESFYYEDNKVLIPPYFSEFILANPSRILYDDKTTAIAKGPEYFVLNSGSTTLGKYIKEFEINNIYKPKFSFTAMLGTGCTSVETTDCKTKVRLHRFDKNTGNLLVTYNITQGNNVEIINPPMESGSYRLEVSNSSFTLNDSENMESNPFSVLLRWTEYKPNVPINSFVGGGRRIVRIETNNNNGKITKRKFTYTLDNGTTSGKLLGIPDYMLVMKKYGNTPMVVGQLSNRIQPMSSFNNGGQVGYSQVTESLLSSSNDILWTKKYNFSNSPDGGRYYRFPYHLPDDMDWARGLNLKTTSYDAVGKTVETLENKYNFSGEEFYPYRYYTTFEGNVVSNNPPTELISPPPAQAPPSYLFSHYVKSIPIYKWGNYVNEFDFSNQSPNIYRTSFFYGGMIKNYQKIKTEYENGLPVKTTTIDTANENLSHHQITKSVTTFPDNTIQETSYQYAHEQNNTDMIAANMIGIPLQTEVKENGKVISKVRSLYGKNAQTSNLVLPVSEQKFDSDNAASAQNIVSYDRYDANGNILQYTTKGSVPTAIIWGYKNTQPIAKIEGATYQEAVALAADIIAKSNEDVDADKEKALMNALDTYRNQSAFKNHSITTYTYDPQVGVTSITPPTGIREFYKYDSMNRLQSVVDANNNILKEFNYHYKN